MAVLAFLVLLPLAVTGESSCTTGAGTCDSDTSALLQKATETTKFGSGSNPRSCQPFSCDSGYVKIHGEYNCGVMCTKDMCCQATCAVYPCPQGYTQRNLGATGPHSQSNCCQANKCSGCTNGIAATGTACATNGGTTCAKCDTGYTLTKAFGTLRTGKGSPNHYICQPNTNTGANTGGDSGQAQANTNTGANTGGDSGQAQACVDGYEKKIGFFVPRKPRRIVSSTSVESCKSLCDDETWCLAFEYATDRETGTTARYAANTCILKSGAPNPRMATSTNKENLDSYIKGACQ